MSEAASPEPTDLRMPPKLELVKQAIARLDSAGLRNKLVKDLPDGLLEGLCLYLVDRTMDVMATWKWLNVEMGGTEDDPQVDYFQVYRFSLRFRPMYQQVRTEHARRISRLSVNQATAGDIDRSTAVAKARLTELLAERLMSIEDLEDVNPKEVQTLLNVIAAHDAGKVKAQELALRVEDSERKTAKLEADLETARLKQAELQAKIDKQTKEFTAKAEAAVAAIEGEASASGGGSETVVKRVREILGL